MTAAAALLQLYKKHAMRGALFNELVAQAGAAAGDDARLLQLIELALDIGSLSLVEHVIRENPLLRHAHPVVSVYAAQCEASRDVFKGATMLSALFASTDRSYGFWWGLSIAAERLLGLDRAIAAAGKALRFADGVQVAKAHGRLAHLYTFAQRRRPAIGHLKRLARMQPAPVGMFGGLALLALENGKAGLAADLATVCLRAAPADVSVVLQCCRALVGAGAAAQAVGPVAALVSRAEQGLALTRAQFDDLLRCCQTIDFGLEQRLATVGGAGIS